MHKLIVFTLLVAAVSVISSCSKSSPQAAKSSDPFEAKLQELSGSGAANCGRTAPNAEVKAASDCALQAAQGKKPFYVAYNMPGLTVGIAGNSEGKLFVTRAETQQGQDAKISSLPCPAELRLAQSGRVTCFPPGVMGPSGGASPHGVMTMPMPRPGTANPHGSLSAPAGQAPAKPSPNK